MVFDEFQEKSKEILTSNRPIGENKYVAEFENDKKAALAPFVEAAKVAVHHGLGLNAGHDLSLKNLHYFAQNVPGLLEVSIGHALICDALYFGLENTIQLYLRQLAS